MMDKICEYVYRHRLPVIPMAALEKRPLVKWKEYQERLPTFDELRRWATGFPACNWAIVTGQISGIVVVDCESTEDAKWFYDERGKSTVSVRTRRGYHLYYGHPGEQVRNAQKIEGRYDVRGDGGYVLAPPSLHELGAYTWQRTSQTCLASPFPYFKTLPIFNMEWRPEPVAVDVESDRKICHGVNYIARIFAVAGERGHDSTYQAACALRESGLDQPEALLSLIEWNQTNASPPWSERELLHKIRSAYA